MKLYNTFTAQVKLSKKKYRILKRADLCQSLADHLHTSRNDFERSEDISEDILLDNDYKQKVQPCK
jgi:hypothetical protein